MKIKRAKRRQFFDIGNAYLYQLGKQDPFTPGVPYAPEGGSLGWDSRYLPTLPLLLNEPWNYPSGQLSTNAAAWNTSTSSFSVVQNGYIWVADALGGVNSTAVLTTPLAYLPNKPFGIDVTLTSAHADTVQVNFDITLASQLSVKWNSDTSGSQFIITGGGVGHDGQLVDTSMGAEPTRSTLVDCVLKVRVGALVAGQRIVKVKATIFGLDHYYTWRAGTPTANTATNFSFGNLTNLQDTGADSCRVSGFSFYGFLT